VASFIAALFIGLFIGTILCGFLADRFGWRAVFIWSLL
jgi:putative MFS transporter